MNGLRVAAILGAAFGQVAAYSAESVRTDAPDAGMAGQPLAVRNVQEMYPGARVHTEGGWARIIYGAPMTAGATAREAAEFWLNAHSAALVTGILELEEVFATPVMEGRFTAIGYQQYVDGLPVEYGNLRVLVRHDDEQARVVYIGATLAEPIDPGQVRLVLDGDTAVQLVQAMPLFRGLRDWGEPERVIFGGDGERIEPIVAWRFVGADFAGDVPRSKSFFVDTATGQLVHVRNEIYRHEVSGSVKGWATPGVLPDTASNPPALQAMPEIRVGITGGPDVFTSRDGLFSISDAGTVQVEIGTGVAQAPGYGGKRVHLTPLGVAAVQDVMQVTPPATGTDFVLNPSPSEQLTAQLNAFIHVTRTHNSFRDRAPDFTELDIPLRVETGQDGTCDAFFNPGLLFLAFRNSGGGCVNTAYSSVVSHEYGHFIVNRLRLGQGGFGEGYSDTTAMLLYDDSAVGRGFFGEGTVLRDPPTANVQYPCPTSGPGSGIHHCGQILGGTWWRIRENLGSSHGSAAGLEMARDMKVAWSLITAGGTGSSFRNSAHPGTAIEVLTVDDDDGYLGNGTPNYADICAAFAAHGIDCPPLDEVDFAFPSGIPAIATIGEPLEIEVHLLPITSQPLPGSLGALYRQRMPGTAGGSFAPADVQEVAPDQYIVRLPASACAEFIDFYFKAQAGGGQVVQRPPGAPASYYTARALGGASETIAFEDDFETDKGWTVWNDPSLASGHWERVIPRGTFFNLQPVQPGSAYRGQRCFLTENGEPGSAVNSHDVDWGPTVLTSPAIDIAGADFADLSFAWWHFTLNGQPDLLEVEVSPDDGQNWFRIAEFDNTTQPRQGSWNLARFDLLQYVTPTSSLRIRFSVADMPRDSLTESAIDDVRVITWRCPESECYANCDGSTTEPILTVDDFTCFINAFAEAQNLPVAEQINHYANCDGSTTAPVLTVDDFTCFINAFATGCP